MRASVTLLQFPALVLALQATPGIVPAGKRLPQVTSVLTPELIAHGLSWLPDQRLTSNESLQGGFNDLTCCASSDLIDGPGLPPGRLGQNDSVTVAADPTQAPQQGLMLAFAATPAIIHRIDSPWISLLASFKRNALSPGTAERSHAPRYYHSERESARVTYFDAIRHENVTINGGSYLTSLKAGDVGLPTWHPPFERHRDRYACIFYHITRELAAGIHAATSDGHMNTPLCTLSRSSTFTYLSWCLHFPLGIRIARRSSRQTASARGFSRHVTLGAWHAARPARPISSSAVRTWRAIEAARHEAEESLKDQRSATINSFSPRAPTDLCTRLLRVLFSPVSHALLYTTDAVAFALRTWAIFISLLTAAAVSFNSAWPDLCRLAGSTANRVPCTVLANVAMYAIAVCVYHPETAAIAAVLLYSVASAALYRRYRHRAHVLPLVRTAMLVHRMARSATFAGAFVLALTAHAYRAVSERGERIAERLTIYNLPSYQYCFVARFFRKLVPDVISAPASASAHAIHSVVRNPSLLIMIIILGLAIPVGGAGTDEFMSSRPPPFDGTRSSYILPGRSLSQDGWLGA